MSLRDVLNDDVSYGKKQAILELGGQVVDILTDLPRGYEYQLKQITPGAMNSETALLIVKKED